MDALVLIVVAPAMGAPSKGEPELVELLIYAGPVSLGLSVPSIGLATAISPSKLAALEPI